MEFFSLEDDDGDELFLTQRSAQDNKVCENVGILGDPMDFSSPCTSIITPPPGQVPVYSDISDVEDFEVPSSQIIGSSTR